MTDNSGGVDRPLTEPERNLINELLVWKIQRNIARGASVYVTTESTVDAIDDLIDKSGMHRRYDEHELRITVGDNPDHVILTARRTWLAFHASPYVAEITEDELERAMSKGDIA